MVIGWKSMAKSGSVKTGTWSILLFAASHARAKNCATVVVRKEYGTQGAVAGRRAGERMGHPPARCPFPYMNLDNGK
jgi:hypothetical protein